jgi:hemolysin-activating ACP:hemolysin acyltransferase
MNVWYDRDWHEPEDAGTDTAVVQSKHLSDEQVRRLSKAERDKIIRKTEAWCTEQEKNGTHFFAVEYILPVGHEEAMAEDEFRNR